MNALTRLARERGVAIIAALLLVLLLSATGLGLALTASLEPALTMGFERRAAALNAAETGLMLAAFDLTALEDWTAVLAAPWCPDALAPAGTGLRVPFGGQSISAEAMTHLLNCQHAEPCTADELQAVTIDRPWGHNNPVFRLLGSVDAGPPGPGEAPCLVLVWAADDPAEVDGEPALDGGPDPQEGAGAWSAGRGRLVLRAEAFCRHTARASVQVVVERRGPAPGVRLRTWVPAL